jgi:hypothetical protein
MSKKSTKNDNLGKRGYPHGSTNSTRIRAQIPNQKSMSVVFVNQKSVMLGMEGITMLI